MKSIKSLLDLPGRIYIFFDSVETKQKFIQQALSEGVPFGDGAIITERSLADIMVLETNGTVHYPGHFGILAFYSRDNSITRINYAKWISGDKKFVIKKKEIKRCTKAK